MILTNFRWSAKGALVMTAMLMMMKMMMITGGSGEEQTCISEWRQFGFPT